MLVMATQGPLDRFYNKWKAILMSESAQTGESTCRIAGASLVQCTQNSGYPTLHITIPGTGRRHLTLSRLMYMCCKREILLHGDVSHLCHNKMCINIDHLVLESRAQNNKRQICNANKSCTRAHEPPCIFP